MSQTGRGMIDFAAGFMPALKAATSRVMSSGALRGRRVGIALTLEPKTACLVEAVASLGAEVAVLGSGHSTKPDVVSALSDAGIRVFAATDGESPDALCHAFIATGIEYLADDGAEVTRRIHRQHRPMLDRLQGVAEETTSGVRPLRVMESQGELAVPVVAVNDARSKLLFDNVYGTGQSVVMAVLDATNLQMSGKRVVVVGYGKVGRGIAAAARALGARVTVTEIDPVEALAALHDGYTVGPLLEVVTGADFVFTATGIGHSLTAEHLAVMPERAVVAVGGAGPPEFDPGPDPDWGDEIRPNVRRLGTGTGATVLVVAEGHCANTTAGEGNPIEIMDLSLALQLRALEYLAASHLAPGVHLLPADIDDEVAATQLLAAGIRIDQPSPDQIRSATSW